MLAQPQPRGVAALGLAVVTLALAGEACQPLGPRAIQQSSDTREVWIYMQGKDADTSGIYRCYDNAGKPQCVRAELTGQLIPSPGFCANHPP